MKDHKIILLGSQCSGKSTLINYLQKTTDFTCIDHDEEIKKRNKGVYPADSSIVNEILLPAIEADVLNNPQVIYSASFFGLDKNGEIDNIRITKAREAGARFVNLVTDMDTLCARNYARIKEGKADASKSLEWYKRVYTDMNELGQFDFSIDTNDAIENIAAQLVSYIKAD